MLNAVQITPWLQRSILRRLHRDYNAQCCADYSMTTALNAAQITPWQQCSMLRRLHRDYSAQCCADYIVKTTLNAAQITPWLQRSMLRRLHRIKIACHVFPAFKDNTVVVCGVNTFPNENFFLILQTDRVCRRKGRNCTLREISPFPTVFLKAFYCRHVKTRICLGKG